MKLQTARRIITLAFNEEPVANQYHKVAAEVEKLQNMVSSDNLWTKKINKVKDALDEFYMLIDK